jgi:ribose/xylose/arabinose/galactoside ABC-type transport system permease subunit
MTDRSTARAGSAISLATDPLHARLDRARLFSWAQTIGIVILFAVILATPGFLTEPSILSLLTTVSFIGCVAVGMTLITISGNIMSFALGATVGVTAMVFILAANRLGLGLGLLVGLTFGSLLTGLQGLLIGWVRANPIIVSIAALALIYGITQAFAEKGRSTPMQGRFPRWSKARSRVSRSSSSYSCCPSRLRSSSSRRRGSGEICSWWARASTPPKPSASARGEP